MYGFFWSSHSFVLFIIIFSSFFHHFYISFFFSKKRRPPGPAFLGVALGQVLIRPLGRPLAFPWNDEKNLNFGPQFLRRKYGKSPQFLRRNRIGILPVEQRIGTDRTDRFGNCSRNRGCTDTFLTVLLNIVKTGHRNGHRNVSQSENKQQSA